MADAGVFDFHEDFIGAGLGDGDFFVDWGAAFLLDDLGPLFLGESGRHDGIGMIGWMERLEKKELLNGGY